MITSDSAPKGIIEIISDKIEDLTKEICSLRDEVTLLRNKVGNDQVWYDLKQACAIKGINYNTVVSKVALQPNHGKPDAIIAGRKRWQKKTIMQWVNVTDSDHSKI